VGGPEVAGVPPGILGVGIAPRSAPHFSQYFASSSFRPPHRLQNIVDHRRSILPVVDCKVTWKAMVAASYVASSGAKRRAFDAPVYLVVSGFTEPVVTAEETRAAIPAARVNVKLTPPVVDVPTTATFPA